MKVKELINILSTFEDDNEVIIRRDIRSLKVGETISKKIARVFKHKMDERFICITMNDDEIEWGD